MKDSELISWPPEREKQLRDVLRGLMGILEINDAGSVSTTRGFELDVYLKVLSSYIRIDGIGSPDDVAHLLYRAVFNRVAHYRHRNLSGLRKALAAESRRFLRRPISDYDFLLPLQIPYASISNSRSVTILGQTLSIRSWQFCQRKYELGPYLRDTQLHVRDRAFSYYENFTPILASYSGRYLDEAFASPNRAFDFLRWLINLQFQYGRTTTRIGGMPKPLGRILPPPTYAVFHPNGSYDTMFYSLTRYDDYPANQLPPEILPQVRRLSRSMGLQESATETKAILIKAISLYGEALDTYDWRHAFLTLWQILELVTLQTRARLSMNQVRGRALSLLPRQELFAPLLDASYKTRNSLVHKGAFPDESGLKEVNLLKIAVERIISRLFSLVRVYRTKQRLERYYQHIQLDTEELADRSRIIRSILSSH